MERFNRFGCAFSSRTPFHGLPLAQQFDCSRPVKRVRSNFQQNRDSLSYLLDPCVAIGTTATIKGFQGGVAIIPPSHMKTASNANHEDEN